MVGLIAAAALGGAWAGVSPAHVAPSARGLAGSADGAVVAAAESAAPLLNVSWALQTGSSAQGNGPEPPTYDSQNGYVYVPNFVARNVTVVEDRAAVTSIDLQADPVASFFDAENGLVYLTATNASAGNNSTALIALDGTSVLAQVSTGNCSGTPAYNSGNGLVYVPNGCSGTVTVVNGTTAQAVIDLPGANPSRDPWVASYDPADGYVYVGDPPGDTLYVINGTSFLTTVTVGEWPSLGTFDPNNDRLYVVNSVSGNLSVVQGTTVVASVPFGGPNYAGGFAYPATYDSANGLLYVPFQGGTAPNATVAVFNGSSELTTINVGPLIAGSSSYAPYGLGTGYVYEYSEVSLNGGQSIGTLTAIGGTSVAGLVNYSSEPVGLVYDAADELVYLSTYTPINVSTGNTTDYILAVACSACNGVTLTESGASSGSAWGVTASNSTTLYAEAADTVAPSPITLHLVNGTYALHVSAQGTVTVQTSSPGVEYDPATDTLIVGSVMSVPPSGGGHGPHPFLPWPLLAVVPAVVGVSIVTAVLLGGRRLRREGEELVEEMRAAVIPGPDDPTTRR
jgi:hypothetical protein